MKQCRWVKPKLVCPVAFVAWADAGHLGHCTFVPMRDDKKTCGGGSRNLRRAEHLSLPRSLQIARILFGRPRQWERSFSVGRIASFKLARASAYGSLLTLNGFPEAITTFFP